MGQCVAVPMRTLLAKSCAGYRTSRVDTSGRTDAGDMEVVVPVAVKAHGRYMPIRAASRCQRCGPSHMSACSCSAPVILD